MGKPTIVTTSWDDGHAVDLRIAELLNSRGLPGTFYVPIQNEGKPTLGRAQIRSLSCGRFEIGSHGLSHRVLTELSTEEVRQEATSSMRVLEDILGSRVQSFCYPKGRYHRWTQNCVREAGYSGARTTEMLAVRLEFGAFEMPTTLQAYPHTRLAYMRNLVKRVQLRKLPLYLTRFGDLPTWVKLGKRLFDSVQRDGGLWHLYGHSWEIERHNLWEDLREMLDYVSGRANALYLTNGQVRDLLCVPKHDFTQANAGLETQQEPKSREHDSKRIKPFFRGSGHSRGCVPNP